MSESITLDVLIFTVYLLLFLLNAHNLGSGKQTVACIPEPKL